MLSNASDPPPSGGAHHVSGGSGAHAPGPAAPAAGSSTEMHPVVAAAARGELPGWAVAGAARREHIARVAGLLDSWAVGLGLQGVERARWRAAGWLHDALREE